MTIKAVDTVAVLIVDDQARNLDVLEAMLEPTGYVVVRAQSADDALLCLLRHEFAAIVLDINMPGMGGIELAQLIKQRKRSQHVPILFLTAHLVDESDILRGYGVGAVDYLSKPLNADILRSKIAVFVDLFQKNRALAKLNDALQLEIVERRRAEEALHQANQELESRVRDRTAALTLAHEGVRGNEERLRMAMNVAQIAAWEWNLETGHMTWSSDPEQLFRFPKGTFGPELRLSRALHPEDKAPVEEAIARAFETGTYEVEFRAMRPEGTIVWVTERGRIVRDAEGAPKHMIGISRDISAQHEAEAERERLLANARAARDEAEQQSRLKDEFLATLSHELRTPMNMILGWLDILISGKPIRDMPSTLAVIMRNARLQAKLIDDLLDMNRLISGNIQLEVSNVDVSVMLQNLLQGLQPAADAKGVRFSTVVAPSAVVVSADPRRIHQVLWNLVHNAIKFTPSDGQVDIDVSRFDGSLRVTVRDSGRGIAPSFLPHVFERFRQEDSSASRESAGLGLGLSIAKHLVELHGGTISAFSPGLGQGATFVVELPAAAAGSTRPMTPPESAGLKPESAGVKNDPLSASA